MSEWIIGLILLGWVVACLVFLYVIQKYDDVDYDQYSQEKEYLTNEDITKVLSE